MGINAVICISCMLQEEKKWYLMECSCENKKLPIREEKPPRRNHIIVPIMFTTSTSCTLRRMTKYGHGKSTYDGLAYHIRDRTAHRPTIYGKWPLIWRHLKIGRVLFSVHPTIYGKRPLIWSHIKIGTVLFSLHLTIYGKLPLIRRHVKIGRVLFSLVTWVPPKRMMCHRL